MPLHMKQTVHRYSVTAVEQDKVTSMILHDLHAAFDTADHSTHPLWFEHLFGTGRETRLLQLLAI